MKAKKKDWFTRIDHVTSELKLRFEDLSVEEWNRKPNADSWSVAENVQHLILVNESYFPLFEKIQKGTLHLPFIARFNLIVNFMGKMILKSVDASRLKRIKTLQVWEPAQGNIQGDILKQFEKQQNVLKNWIQLLAPIIKSGALITSPANHNLVYTLEKAVEIIVTHEQRHLNQAIEAFDIIFENQYKLDM